MRIILQLFAILLLPANQSPLAYDDHATVMQFDTVVIDVLANDIDPDGTLDPASIVLQTTPRGTITINGDGTLSYFIDDSFVGTENFRYTVKDDLGAESNQATVFVTVTPTTNPVLSASGFVAGGMGRVTVSNATQYGRVGMAFSVTGPGPVHSPFGLISVSQPVTVMPVVIADGWGVANNDIAVPKRTAGRMVWFHAVDIQRGLLSNPLEVVIQ